MTTLKPIEAPTPDATRDHAASIAATCGGGEIFLLKGDLGAGKTEWVKGFAQTLGYSGEVTSPTFSLSHEYPGSSLTLYHWDLYRLDSATDWDSLDLYDHLRDPHGVTLVEWPERFPHPWPPGAITVTLSILENETRRIECPCG